MTFLENRIPPPAVLILALLLMKAVSLASVNKGGIFTLPWAGYLPWAGLAVAILGVGIAITGVLAFKKAQTTVNPLAPSRATQLVTSSIFSVSRNPMYLGMLMVAIGWALALASVLPFALVVLFALYINRFQIVPEERAMAKLFGADFDLYCAHTRRWI